MLIPVDNAGNFKKEKMTDEYKESSSPWRNVSMMQCRIFL